MPEVTMHSSLTKPGRLIDYSRSWAWQQILLSRRLALRRAAKTAGTDNVPADDNDIVLMFEHAPVYTLGRGADENYLTFLQNDGDENMKHNLSRSYHGAGSARLAVDRRVVEDHLLSRSDEEAVDILSKLAHPVFAPNGAPIYRVERGGEVTFHGPGQLVVYPLFDLQRQPHKPDLSWYLHMIEETIIVCLRHYGIEGRRDEINTGVWVDRNKVAAVGVSASRWVTTHGFALNVCPDLSYFDPSCMVPCGIAGRGVTSISEIILQKNLSVSEPTIADVSNVVLDALQETFKIKIHLGHEIF